MKPFHQLNADQNTSRAEFVTNALRCGTFIVFVMMALRAIDEARAQTVVITVTNRVYLPYSVALPADAWVYVDADPASGSPVRATQRSLGYREVDYKAQVPATLGFAPVTPTTNDNVITYDYSAQAAKTNTVGFWVDKNVPIIVGPDGNAYITSRGAA